MDIFGNTIGSVRENSVAQNSVNEEDNKIADS